MNIFLPRLSMALVYNIIIICVVLCIIICVKQYVENVAKKNNNSKNRTSQTLIFICINNIQYCQKRPRVCIIWALICVALVMRFQKIEKDNIKNRAYLPNNEIKNGN